MLMLWLSLGLLLSGTLSTMTAKAADRRGFDHPFVQVLFMFVGECLCLFIAPCFGKGVATAPDLFEAKRAVDNLDSGPEPRQPSLTQRDGVANIYDDEAVRLGLTSQITSAEMDLDDSLEQFPLSDVREPQIQARASSVSGEDGRFRGSSGEDLERELLPSSDGVIASRLFFLDFSVYETSLSFWKFALAALLDALGSSLIFLGIQRTTPAKFQLMRSSLVPFTCLVSYFLLGRVPKSFHYLGIAFIVCGIILVSLVSDHAPIVPDSSQDDLPGEDLPGLRFIGLQEIWRLNPADIFVRHNSSDRGSSQPVADAEELLGNLLIVLAQFVLAFQLVFEEHAYKGKVNTLVAVGLEGICGVFITGLLIFCLQLVPQESKPYGRMESLHAAFDEIGQDSNLALVLALNALAVTALNSFGVSLMVEASAPFRTVVDTLRLVFIWMASLAVGWEKTISGIQLVSFVLLVIGILTYNMLMKWPCISYVVGFEVGDDADTRTSRQPLLHARRQSADSLLVT